MLLNNFRWMLKKAETLFRSLPPGNVCLLPPKHKEKGMWASVLGGSPGPGMVQGTVHYPHPMGTLHTYVSGGAAAWTKIEHTDTAGMLIFGAS